MTKLDTKIAHYRTVYGITFGPAYCLATMSPSWQNRILHKHEMWRLRYLREYHRHVAAPELQKLIRQVGMSGSIAFPL